MWPLVRIDVTIRNSIPILRIFTIWRVAGWQRSIMRPSEMRMQNGPPFIIDCLSLGGGSRGGVFNKCSDIYTPTPKTDPDQGMLNRYFPSRETPRRWHTRTCPIDPRLGVGVRVLYLERVCCDTGTVTPHQNRLCILYADHHWHAPPAPKDG